VLLFGATGGAGGSVLRVCLASPIVGTVRTITRRPVAITDAKLQPIVHEDFLDYSTVSASFAGVDACLFCLGVSATQVSEEQAYRRITHDFAVAAARMLHAASPAGVFHFVSGTGADLDSRFMWARVKAETERDLMALGGAVCWRPAYIDGEHSDNAPLMLKIGRPLFRVLKPFRSMYVAGEDIGLAMLQATLDGTRTGIIDNTELRFLADRTRAQRQ
jgi:uncharacterized protein YbjT (DUF2867 family)